MEQIEEEEEREKEKERENEEQEGEGKEALLVVKYVGRGRRGEGG